MTPFRTQGVILTRDSDEWDLRSLLHDCWDWSDLRAGANKDGANRPLPAGGVGIRSRISRDVTGVLAVRVNGFWTENSTPRNGGETAWAKAADETLEDLMTFLQHDDPCTVTLKRAGDLTDLTGLLQVENPGHPALKGARASWAVQFTLPNGRLTAAS